MANTDATLTPAMLAIKRWRAGLVERIAEADAHVLEAAAVTIIVTLPEAGAAQPTFSTIAYTAWGGFLEKQTAEVRMSLAEIHCVQAEKIVRSNAETTREMVARQRAEEAEGEREKPA